MKQKDHAAAVGQPACLDRGVQMETDGEFGGCVSGKRLAGGPGKAIFAVERAAVGAEVDGTGVYDAAVADVSVMRRTQRRGAGLPLNSHIARAGNDGRAAKQLSDRKGFEEAARGSIIQGDG